MLLCFVSRLPQLLSDHLFLDGDESIVGLMAIHFSQGNGVPFFFYGQSYGFSFIEVAIIRLFYWFFGVTDISIKLAMLTLWTVGIVFFYKTLKQFEHQKNKWAPLLVTCIFIFAPAFAIWSMKARGGYLTAFLISSVVIYLMSHRTWNKKLITAFIIGFSVSIIYQSQALWLAGVIPILVYYLFNTKHFKHAITLFSGLIIGLIIFHFLKEGLSTYWSPSVLSIGNINLDSLLSIPSNVYQNLTGSYSYRDVLPSLFITKIIAGSLAIFIFISIFLSLRFVIKKATINIQFHVLSVSVLFTIGYLILVDGSNFRYLLPLCGFAILMLYFFLIHLKQTKIVNSFLLIFIILGAISLYDFRNVIVHDQAANRSVTIPILKKLEEDKIHFIYCEDGLLQWQLMFYSEEKIIARYKNNTDRYPGYIRQVDNAFNTPNTTTALVAIDGMESFPSSLKGPNDYVVYSNPTREMLIERGFDLSKPLKNK